jgi:hypothetical protein
VSKEVCLCRRKMYVCKIRLVFTHKNKIVPGNILMQLQHICYANLAKVRIFNAFIR